MKIFDKLVNIKILRPFVITIAMVLVLSYAIFAYVFGLKL